MWKKHKQWDDQQFIWMIKALNVEVKLKVGADMSVIIHHGTGNLRKCRATASRGQVRAEARGVSVNCDGRLKVADIPFTKSLGWTCGFVSNLSDCPNVHVSWLVTLSDVTMFPDPTNWLKLMKYNVFVSDGNDCCNEPEWISDLWNDSTDCSFAVNVKLKLLELQLPWKTLINKQNNKCSRIFF